MSGNAQNLAEVRNCCRCAYELLRYVYGLFCCVYDFARFGVEEKGNYTEAVEVLRQFVESEFYLKGICLYLAHSDRSLDAAFQSVVDAVCGYCHVVVLDVCQTCWLRSPVVEVRVAGVVESHVLPSGERVCLSPFGAIALQAVAKKHVADGVWSIVTAIVEAHVCGQLNVPSLVHLRL